MKRMKTSCTESQNHQDRKHGTRKGAIIVLKGTRRKPMSLLTNHLFAWTNEIIFGRTTWLSYQVLTTLFSLPRFYTQVNERPFYSILLANMPGFARQFANVRCTQVWVELRPWKNFKILLQNSLTIYFVFTNYMKNQDFYYILRKKWYV